VSLHGLRLKEYVSPIQLTVQQLYTVNVIAKYIHAGRIKRSANMNGSGQYIYKMCVYLQYFSDEYSVNARKIRSMSHVFVSINYAFRILAGYHRNTFIIILLKIRKTEKNCM